jgi:hypothetical protein
LDQILYPKTKPDPVAEFQYIDYTGDFQYINSTKEPITKSFFYKLNSTSLGPFDLEESNVKMFLNDVVFFKINYTMMTKYPFLYSDNFECSEWRVLQKYSFETRGHLVCTLDIRTTTCMEDFHIVGIFENIFNKMLWIHLLVIILAIMSLFFTLNEMHMLLKMYMEAKNRARQKAASQSGISSYSSTETHYYNPLFESSSEDEETGQNNFYQNNQIDDYSLFYDESLQSKYLDKKPNTSNNRFYKNNQNNDYKNLHIQEKQRNDRKIIRPIKHFKFLQFWSLFIIVGNFLQLCGAFLALSSNDEITTVTSILIGSGCLFACLSTGKYIEKHPDYSTIYETLKRSFPVVTRFLLGVLPIFLGFLFLGVAIFRKSERFNTISTASYSLFAMIQGDALWDTITDISSGSLIGQIYCYSFCVLFILIVLNIFISIIEEAYVVTKIKNKTSWVYKYVTLQPKLVEMKLHSKVSLEFTKNYFKNIDKTSEILKKKVSQSFKSVELYKQINNYNPYSIENTPKPKSLSHTQPKNKYSQKVKEIPESILENEEFLLDQNLRKSISTIRHNIYDLKRKASINYNKKDLDMAFMNVSIFLKNLK